MGKSQEGREKFQLQEGAGDRRGEKRVDVPERRQGNNPQVKMLFLTDTVGKELGKQRGEFKSKRCLQ